MKRISLQVKKKPQPPVKLTQQSNDLAPIRVNTRKILKQQLNSYFTEDELNELEDSIHQTAWELVEKHNVTHIEDTRFIRQYNILFEKVGMNLDPAYGNPDLINQIKSGVYKLTDLPRMDDTQLNPDEWDHQIKSRAIESQNVADGPSNVVTTTLIKCSKCGAGVTYKEEQTRSCDEAMTIKAECINCGKRFNI